MAKRRKHTRRRARRVGGGLGFGGKDTGMKLLAVGAGYLLADTINGFIDPMLPQTKDAVPVVTKDGQTIGMAAQLGIGGLLLLKKQSGGSAGTAMKVAGGILVGAGLKRAMGVLGLKKAVTGYQQVPVIGRHRMAGYQQVPVIGSTPIPAQLSGRTPAQLNGYRPAGSGVGGYIPRGSGMGVLGSIGSNTGGSGITANSGGTGYMN
jgi:hypothetical protein